MTATEKVELVAELDEARRRVAELERALGQSDPSTRPWPDFWVIDGPIAKLFDFLDHIVWIADIGEQIKVFISPAYEKIWGRSRQQLYADPSCWVEAIHPEDRERVQALFDRLDGNLFHQEFRIIAADGTIRWITDDGYVERDDDGQPRRMVGLAQDITARKLAEEKLHREQQFTDEVIDSLPGNFYLLDETGRFLRWNRAFLEASGYTAEEVARMHPLDFVEGSDKQLIAERIAQAFTEGEATAELTMVAKDGKRTPYFYTGKLIVLDGSRCLVGMGINVEQRRHLEEQLRQAQKMKAVGQLAGGIAHDFNNLLTVICCCSEVLLSRQKPEDPGREMLQQIFLAGNRAADLTRQLLAFGRRTVLEPKVLDLNTLVVNLEKMLRPLMGEDVTLELKLAADLGRVKADPGQIEQVIMNLAVNARDATPQGGKITIWTANADVVLDPRQDPADFRNGPFVLLAVTDTGHGMTDEVMAHLFEPFFSTKGLGKGTGLGLATVYGIIQESGGQVAVDSQPSQGTTFKIWLPRVEESLPVEEPLAVVRPLTGSETILLVEDEPAVRALARNALQENGYKVLEARDGQDALVLARQQGPIHLLLTDVVMPLVSGRQLAEQLLQERPDIKVLYMSGYTDDAVVRRGVQAAEVALLQKPFAPLGLLLKVREVLDEI